jgi:putative transposase
MRYMKEKHGRGYVYSIQYHLVWCTKYRKKILDGNIESTLKAKLKKIAVENEFEILEMECDKDHVHLLVDCSPQHFIPNIIKAMKGVSARHMFKEHPEIKNKIWGGSLWNPSYYVSTVSDTTEEQIRRYIQSQKEK